GAVLPMVAVPSVVGMMVGARIGARLLHVLKGSVIRKMVIALLLQTLYSYIVHPILFFFFILLVVRLYFCYKRSIHSITYIALLDSLIGGLLDWTHRTFYARQTVNDRKLVISSLVVLIIAWIGSSLLLRLLLSLLTKTGI
ncbi:MAG TPA: YggT family protein, partial [Sphaerochaeta sp.]|nr:YggT family protein [Sphaerochaeta sp.]